MTAQPFYPATGTERPAATRDAAVVDGAAAAFGLSAVVAILFNTALAWIKDSVPALNSLMAHMTGHHWRTHGLADVLVFLALGFALMGAGFTIRGTTLAGLLAAAIVVAGGGLGLWFLLV